MRSASINRRKFQPRYQIHEYPGRKPWYVIRKYIDSYSRRGETILDPFCGSGVVPCEALIARRKAVATDINPLAVLLSKVTCISPLNLKAAERAFRKVERAAKDSIHDLYKSGEKCAVCGGELIASSAARMPDERKVKVRAYCSKCSKFCDLTLDMQDREKSEDSAIPYWHPGESELPDGIRGNIRYLRELYTDRNLKALSILWHNINLIRDETNREILKLCFSATLSKASKMNVPKITGKGWTSADYNVYNVPDNYIEFNVWDGYSNKFFLCLEAKTQTNHLIGDFYDSRRTVKILRASAENLTFIPDRSIDYVLTDPPYADLVRYYERNFVRNAWLGFESDHSSEEYPVMIRSALMEVHRVLKPGRRLSVLLKETSRQFRDEFVALAEDAGLMHKITDLEYLGYSNTQQEPTDHALNFVNL